MINQKIIQSINFEQRVEHSINIRKENVPSIKVRINLNIKEKCSDRNKAFDKCSNRK